MIAERVFFTPWWGVFGGLLWVAFLVLVVLLVVGAVGGRASRHGGLGAPSALRILEERYARGEISREEFLERRAVLSGESPPAPPGPPSPPGDTGPPPAPPAPSEGPDEPTARLD